MSELQAIAEALGGEVCGGAVSVPGPGHSRYDRSLRVFLDPIAPDGFRVTSFAGDNWQVCRDHVKTRLGISDKPRQEAKPKAREPEDRDRIDRARQLWHEAKEPGGSPVEAYLASRGLMLAHGLDRGHVLRFHAVHAHFASRVPRQCAFRLCWAFSATSSPMNPAAFTGRR